MTSPPLHRSRTFFPKKSDSPVEPGTKQIGAGDGDQPRTANEETVDPREREYSDLLAIGSSSSAASISLGGFSVEAGIKFRVGGSQ